MEMVDGGEGVVWDHLDVASTVQRSAGHAVDAYTERGGARYVLEVSDPADVAKLKQITELSSGIKVRVGAHPSLNRVRCVFSSKDIINVSEKVLKEHFATQGVVDVHRICRGKGEGKVNTSSVVLTCEGTSFPETVKFGLLRIRTRAYYALPLQCYNCYGYGHGRAGCKNKARCRVCSGVHEIAEKCRAKAFCSNCRGNHQPTNRKCPTYVKEVEILRLKTDLGVSYGDAKKVFIKEKSGKSYAKVAGAPPVDSGKNPQVVNTPKKGKAKKKKKKKAKKSGPQGKGPDGAGPSSSEGAKTDNQRATQTKSVGVGASPPVGVATGCTSEKTAGREGDVATATVGTDPLPDADIPLDSMEKQLLLKKVESLTKENAHYRSKNRQLQESNSRLEQERSSLVGQLERAGASHDNVELISLPLTRRKRKLLTVLDGAVDHKCRKQGDDSTESSPPVSVPDRESGAVTGNE